MKEVINNNNKYKLKYWFQCFLYMEEVYDWLCVYYQGLSKDFSFC